MSYKTNPIFNRVKVIKGWKNPYLPTKTLNYSRDISLWFKVYLLLKQFLNLKKIQLLSFEIRLDQQNKKLLYLVINKKKVQKKRKKKKLSFKKIRTPLRKSINLNSIFFFYNDLKLLKQISFWNQNVMHKKILSKFWLTKPRISTWINTVEKNKNLRHFSKNKNKFLKKGNNFIPTQYAKINFYTKKQKQILAQKLKLQKINTVLYTKLFEIIQQRKIRFFKQWIFHLKKKINQNQIVIKKINLNYEFLLQLVKKESFKKNNNIFLKKRIISRFEQNKITILKKIIKKEFRSLNHLRFLRQKFPKFFLKFEKSISPRVSILNLRFLTKDSLLKKVLHLNFLIAELQNKNFLPRNYFLTSNFKFALKEKEKKTQKKNKINMFLENLRSQNFFKSQFRNITKKKQFHYFFYKITIWFLLRLKKKKRKYFLKKFNQDFKVRIGAKYFSNEKAFNQTKIKHNFSKHLKKIKSFVKKNQTLKHYQYRLPYKKNYFNFLHLMTQFKLKYLIQNFIQKYFNLQIEAKVIHFLNEQKNKNYFRLVFPIWKKKKSQFLRKFRQKKWKQKQIFLTSQLQFATTTKNIKLHKAENFLFKDKTFKQLKKKTLSTLTQKKIKNSRIKNSFKRIKNSKDFRHSFKYFIPLLMHFSRTLEPQFLADILAKILYKAKKQTWMLSAIKDILKMINLGRNVGYKIALAGRVNSSDKSRLIYILRKNVPLQIFDKNMNFAYSQAKARIGVFGIKIWVYF